MNNETPKMYANYFHECVGKWMKDHGHGVEDSKHFMQWNRIDTIRACCKQWISTENTAIVNLVENPQPTCINLNNKSINDNDIPIIGSILTRNIKCVHLKDNDITANGFEQLIEMLQHERSSGLHILDIRNNPGTCAYTDRILHTWGGPNDLQNFIISENDTYIQSIGITINEGHRIYETGRHASILLTTHEGEENLIITGIVDKNITTK